MAYIHPTLMWMVLLFVGVITKQGYGWNLPNTYYQGADSGGYYGGRGAGSVNNQGLGGAGSWSTGGVGTSGGGGFQGQTGGGTSGGIDRTVGFGTSQWTGGDGNRAPAVVAGGVSTTGDSFGADGTGFQQAGGINSGAPLATGSRSYAGYDNQASLGNFGTSNVGVGQFTPHHANGPVPNTNAFEGSFGPSGSGFGAGGEHYHGKRPTTSTYGAPSAQPWRYGAPTNYGGYGAARWPWYGNGYVYRVPVAHINPDGSYSFSYYTPYTSREENGHSNGNVEGTYGFQNDGAKHNFSFNAGPDVDLRSGVGDSRVGVLHPEEYGPQSVHSRARLPVVPQTTIQPGVDEQTRRDDADGRTQVPSSWSSRSGVDVGANDQNSLSVVGLPRASTEATLATTAPNQIGRGSTESVGVNDLEGRVSQPDGTVTTVPPLAGSVEQVVTRPENEIPSFSNEIGKTDMQYNGVVDGGYKPYGTNTPNTAQDGTFSPDRSYRFGYQTPNAAREEAADQAGNVRGSFSYNNEAGRNDLQYVAGAGMGFRPTGGSLSVPNGLAGAGPITGGPVSNDRRYQFGYRTTVTERGESANVPSNGQGTYQYVGGAGTGLRATGDSLSVPNGQRDDASVGVGGIFGGSNSGLGGTGVTGNQGGQGVGGSFGASDTGFGGTGVTGNQGGQGVGGSFGASDTGFGGTGVTGNQGGQGVEGSFRASDTGFGGTGVTGNQGGQGVGGSGVGFGGIGVTGNQAGNFGGASTAFGGTGVPGNLRGQGVGGNFEGTGSGFGVAGGNFGGSTAGFGSDGKSRAFGNQGKQFGAGTGAGVGSDGRPLAFGNQGTQQGGVAGATFGGLNTGFGGDGRSLVSGNQGARGNFGGSDGRSFAFGNQAGQGFPSTGTRSTVGFAGNQGTTHNPVTRSPTANAFNGASTDQRNGFNTANGSPTTRGSVLSTEDKAEENTTINDDDSEQTTTFGGYGDVAGAGLYTNGNRRLVQ